SKPVLLASGLTTAVTRTDRLLTQAVVPLDGSHASRAVLPFVEVILAGLPRDASGSLKLLHVIPSDHYAAGPLIARRVPDTTDEMAKLRSQAKQYLEEVSRGIRGRNVSVETHVAVGDPAITITETATELKADFIAMTTHGISGFSRLFLGSVADRVLHTSATPLLLFKPTES
ncbi:MAG: universal stress protein, partial [Chloroflexota bacterium]